MIVQFPSFYPDELVYSLLARYSARSGYLRYTFAAEELLERPGARPDPEFVNRYTAQAVEAMTRDLCWEEVIERHTMFPYYGRFLPWERRQQAFDALVHMRGNHRNLLAMPKQKPNRCLRYCPECARADREQYGETYWHRLHQIPELSVCVFHHCRLEASGVPVVGRNRPDLVCAETEIGEAQPGIPWGNVAEYRVAEYVAQVFLADLDRESRVEAGEFLHARMGGTPYRSVRGEQRNMARFREDFLEFYRELEGNRFTEEWKMQKILNGYRYHPYEICLMGLFLGVTVPQLVNRTLPERTQEQEFDETVRRLREQGLQYPEIAKRLNAPYDTVKSIGEGRYKKRQKNTQEKKKGGIPGYDWETIDRETLPAVKEAIRKLWGNGETRPKKVTVHAVETLLGLPSKRISVYLPLCRKEIERYQETQEEYWAREASWAVDRLQKEGKTVNWTNIRKLTNMRRRDFLACQGLMDEKQKRPGIKGSPD